MGTRRIRKFWMRGDRRHRRPWKEGHEPVGPETFLRTLPAVAAVEAVLSRIVIGVKILAAAVSPIAGLSTMATRYRTLAATATGVSDIVPIKNPDSNHPNEPSGFVEDTDASRVFSAVTEGAWDYQAGGFSIQTKSAPRSPTDVGQMWYGSGLPPGNAPGITQAEGGWGPASSLYQHLFIKISDPFYSHGSNINKIGFISDLSWGTGATMIVPMYFGSEEGLDATYTFRVVIQGTYGADGAYWQNAGPGGADVMEKDTWVELEWYCVMNTGTNSDGEWHTWLDGVKIMEYTNLAYEDGTKNGTWDSLKWNPTWGGSGGIDLPNNQQMWIDDWYVSVPP